MRQGLGRIGGTLAVALSAIWALPAAGLVVFGLLLVVSGSDSDASIDPEGFAKFVGGGMAVAGLFVLVSAVGGILLGVRVRRGRNGARLGLGLLSPSSRWCRRPFLASAFADESGVDPGGVVMFGVNTAVCLAIVVCVVLGRQD